MGSGLSLCLFHYNEFKYHEKYKEYDVVLAETPNTFDITVDTSNEINNKISYIDDINNKDKIGNEDEIGNEYEIVNEYKIINKV
tara:strand:+ start:223 stop:474 length:252 start_codon:yes stop_codon:yes gene_type:complete